MKVLVANIGSTSFKYQVIDMANESVLAKGKVERVGSPKAFLAHRSTGRQEVAHHVNAPDHAASIKLVIDLLLDPENGALKNLTEISAVGFKTVHAGRITGSVLITEEVVQAMKEFDDVVPAHNRPYINGVRIFQKLLPDTPLVGVFETSFHRGIPDYAHTYSVPYEWYEKHGVRRYGFHGASHRYVSERVPQILGRLKEDLKIISCHLGGSSSLCAVKGGRSVDTSMGFSAQSGVPMSSRCGDVDPFIIPYIMDKEGLTTAQLREALTKRSGLRGISGVSEDVRDLEEAAAKGDRRAALALNVFAYEVKKYIGAYTAVMGGLDVLVFTGGTGESGVDMRRRICEGLEFLGIELDPVKNNCQKTEAIISKEGAKVTVMVVPTNEEIIVAREAVNVVKSLPR